MIPRDELQRRVAEIPYWFHRLDLGQGVVTPGRVDPARNLPRLRLPSKLAGLTVLDVGAWDGFYSFEAERRGAARILATDSFCWDGEGPGTKSGFDLAREALSSKVEDRIIDVLELSPERVGVFDLVLFLGVLYHMRHPLLALEKVFSVTRERCILETHVDLLGGRRPAAVFYPGRELENDPTNWWGPNPACVHKMLEAVGFTKVEMVTKPHSWFARTRWLLRSRQPMFPALWQGRAVFHAWR